MRGQSSMACITMFSLCTRKPPSRPEWGLSRRFRSAARAVEFNRPAARRGQKSAGVAAGPRRAATGGRDVLGHRDLLLLGGQVGPRRVGGTAAGGPGRVVELQAAVVAVA